MTWYTELTLLRRYLRDPDGNIWDEALLRELYNEVQDDFQTRTGILETIRAMPVPPRWQMAYAFEWEWDHIDGSQAWWTLRHQQHHFTYSAIWEVQEQYGFTGDAPDPGNAWVHPWEAWYAAAPGRPVPMPWPDDYANTKAMYHDEEPLDYDPRKLVTSNDPSWQTREGEPDSYHRLDRINQCYYLYPRPSTVTWNDVSGTGMATSVSGDTTDAEVGVVVRRTGSWLSDNLGLTVDVVDTEDNVLMVYDQLPTRMASMGDAPIWPSYLLKYVRYGVLSKAYQVNNDGRIESLASFWRMRYELGARAIKRFMRARREDRNYRLHTPGTPRSVSRRHPRLPSTYPPI